MDLYEKFEALKNYIRELESVAVAFSGGVDSTFLLKTAAEVLGDNVTAITARSYLFPKREMREAYDFCITEGIRHIEFDARQLDIEGFCKNPPNRCYICKKDLFGKIMQIAKDNNIKNIIEGSNADDVGDYRPGMQAIKELGIKSPLKYAGLKKDEIRALSKEMGLATWKKPSLACLATRFEYGDEIDLHKLDMIDKAEQLLLDMGFYQVRVRIHGNIARIEIDPNEFDKLIKEENRLKITDGFRRLGFAYTAMDLSGYRTGSMNETLDKTNADGCK